MGKEVKLKFFVNESDITTSKKPAGLALYRVIIRVVMSVPWL